MTPTPNVERLRQLLAETSLPWRLHTEWAFVCDADNRETADCGYGDGMAQHDLITEGINALPALLDSHERLAKAEELLRAAFNAMDLEAFDWTPIAAFLKAP